MRKLEIFRLQLQKMRNRKGEENQELRRKENEENQIKIIFNVLL